MAPADIRRHHEALDWVRRIHDPAFADWDAHLAWLEASPANGAAFDAVSLDLEAATARLQPARRRPQREDTAPGSPMAVPPARPAWRRFAPAVGIGLAAAVVGLVSLPSLGPAAPPLRYRTMAGEQRVVHLPDGTRIALNGDTEVTLDRAGARDATLVHGEALFSVTHNARNPFAVHAGDAVFQDVGTVFNVVRSGDRAELAVREGAVLYDPEGAKLRVDAGRALLLADGADAVLRPVTAADVGGWRSGRLTYTDAPMTDVADDIARSTGRPVLLDAAVRERPFSGVIVLDKDGTRLARHVAAATGLVITRNGTGWRMALPAR